MCVCLCVCVCVCVLVIKVLTDFFDILNGLYDFKRWEMVRYNYDQNLKLGDLLSSNMTHH